MSGGKLKIVIIVERCKGCGLCVDVCPQGVLAIGEERNTRGYRHVVAKAPERCAGCGLCELTCPDFAIAILRGDEDEAADGR